MPWTNSYRAAPAKPKKVKRELPPPGIILSDCQALTLTIPGAPMTKKNHPQIVNTGEGRRPLLLPSPEWRAYEKDCLKRMSDFVRQTAGYLPINYAVGVKALFYRQANTGDLNNYQAGLADLLQKAEILSNDSLIESWDGSRKLKDAIRPRVEIEIKRFGIAQGSLGL